MLFQKTFLYTHTFDYFGFGAYLLSVSCIKLLYDNIFNLVEYVHHTHSLTIITSLVGFLPELIPYSSAQRALTPKDIH